MSKAAAFQADTFSRKQKQLIHWWREGSPYSDCFISIAEGSVRSGKTIAEIISFLTWSFQFKDQNFIVAGKSIGAMKRNVVEPMTKILNAMGITYRYLRSEVARIEIEGSRYYFFGANNEAAQDYMQGITARGGLVDEAALIPQSFVNQLMARVSSFDDSKLFFNCNPESPFHFIKTDFIDKAKEKGIYCLKFTLDDNPILSDEAKARIKKQFAGVFYRRMILGEWCLAEGAIYDMFDETKCTYSEPFKGKIQNQWIAVDYGTGNPTVFLHQIQGADDIIRTSAEYYYDSRAAGVQKTDSQYASDMEEWKRENNIGDITTIVDPSAASFKAELSQRGISVQDANNDVVNGIRRVQVLLQQGRYLIHESCSNTIREYSSYCWDTKKQKIGIDAPIKENDHCKDAERYGIYTMLPEDCSHNINYARSGRRTYA